MSTYVGGNALPGPSLEHVAETHWQFELFKAGLLPRVEITEASAETLSNSDGTRIVKVTATVTNTGQLATHLERGARLAGNRNDAIWLIGDRNRVNYLQGDVWQSLGTLSGVMATPGGGEGGAQSGNTREVTWLVSIEGNSPLKLVLTSQKGGTRVRELTVR